MYAFETSRAVQFGCMLQRGYYPITDSRLRGTFILALTQDPLPVMLSAESTGEEVSYTMIVSYSSFDRGLIGILRPVVALSQ